MSDDIVLLHVRCWPVPDIKACRLTEVVQEPNHVIIKTKVECLDGTLTQGMEKVSVNIMIL